MAKQDALKAIPTNIITGFLGSGKTTTILELLKNKPADERWAVLVNEFGEIGIDGNLIQGQHSQQGGVFIKEVPGGCMCCSAGLPMQVALNALLVQARPDRLLIEPTGLGHPKEVLDVLAGVQYRDSLSLQKILTLVDARNIADKRYTQHETFNQQVDIADVLIASKADKYSQAEVDALAQYANQLAGSAVQVVAAQHGAIDPDLLKGLTKSVGKPACGHSHAHSSKPDINQLAFPENGVLKVENSGQGFHSVGWRFAPHLVFDRDRLYGFLCGINAERMKAVFVTQQGSYGYNFSKDALTEMVLENSGESRVEIIANEISSEWERGLLNCLLKQAPNH
ncbi:CobW family GTP-binding protein [Paraferrimonas sedimenticola]|uniref:CobW/HypB/UreG nucleotide-binding domain-containing protein n=1 Tax=Paraferrimonas sedimenticola TaxID=375674 RepID=A0AA37VZX3_9GAMM|nr:GTP-binding protein [Paraferrimonas sedimenticola]GLP97871.1 hypothetical protein GCM10007895_31780 [Paraferrimonas sedimenticola]